MMPDSIALIGWHEGSAGQIHSWFESTSQGKIECFIHPEDSFPRVTRIARPITQFSYPENHQFKDLPLYCKFDWPQFILDKGIKKALITLTDPLQRFTEMTKATKAGIELINAIHPTALLMPECVLGRNVILHANTVVGYRSEIDTGAIVNIGTQIDHHCKVSTAVTLDPAVVMAGNVHVEELCIIHTGAIIINRIYIGKKSVIGAGAVVIKDVPANSTFVGNPAKPITRRVAE